MTQKRKVFSIDVGSSVSGVVCVDDENIHYADVLDNSLIIGKVREFLINDFLMVIIEDIRPFKKGLAMQTIETAKFIGELKYRLSAELNVDYLLIPRFDVKRWVFNSFPDVVVDRINSKIEYLDLQGERLGRKRYRKKTGELYKPTLHYVDDRIVIAAMKEHWGIETPKPGKKNKYGLHTHSWQALALATMYLNTNDV